MRTKKATAEAAAPIGADTASATVKGGVGWGRSCWPQPIGPKQVTVAEGLADGGGGDTVGDTLVEGIRSGDRVGGAVGVAGSCGLSVHVADPWRGASVRVSMRDSEADSDDEGGIGNERDAVRTSLCVADSFVDSDMVGSHGRHPTLGTL